MRCYYYHIPPGFQIPKAGRVAAKRQVDGSKIPKNDHNSLLLSHRAFLVCPSQAFTSLLATVSLALQRGRPGMAETRSQLFCAYLLHFALASLCCRWTTAPLCCRCMADRCPLHAKSQFDSSAGSWRTTLLIDKCALLIDQCPSWTSYREPWGNHALV